MVPPGTVPSVGRLVASVLLVQPWTSRGALSVFPYESDGIVLRLRSTVMLDERDLLEPAPPRTCSSFSDGPFCARFPSAPATMARSSLSGASAQYVVDGILSHWLRSRHGEAFAWSSDTLSTFSGQISRVVAETLTRRIVRAATSGGPTLTSITERSSKSRFFRLALHRIPPWQVTVPINFSSGLSGAADVTWEGRWEAKADRLILQTALGYIRFARPVVACRFLVSVPVATEDEGGQVWGRDALICGRLKGREQWCTSLDHAAAAARHMGELHFPSMAISEQGELHADVGNGLRAVDELAVLAAPPGGLAMLKLEVSATPSAGTEEQPTDSSTVAAERQVVLLRKGQGAASVEPTLAVVARDAVVWDMNEVLRQNMLLRTTPSEASGRASMPQRPVAAKRELASFQEMLQGLKSRTLPLPPGVTLQQLKREVGVLVASTKELQDDDVLLHTKIESLLQKRLREKRLDALIALQAAWRRKYKAIAHDEGEVGDDTVASDVTEATEAGPDWAAGAADAVERASAEIEKKGTEMRAKLKGLDTQSFDLQMDGEGKVQVHIAKVDMSSMADLVNQVVAAARGGGNMPSSIGGSSGRESEAEDVGEIANVASEAVATAIGTTDVAEDEATADGGKNGGGADEIARTMARMLSEAANVEVANLGDATVEVAHVAHASTPEALQEMLGPLLEKMLSGANQASKSSLDIDAVQEVFMEAEAAEKAAEEEPSLDL